MIPVFPFKRRLNETALYQEAEKLITSSHDANLKPENTFSNGENRRNIKGHSGDFRQFRTYAPQDRPQDIDWKRSARSDDILIREREQKLSQPLQILMDDADRMHFNSSSSLKTKYEAAAVIALALAMRFCKNHDAVYFRNENIKPPALSNRLLEKTKTVDFTPRHHAIPIFFSDFLNDRINFNSLNQKLGILFHVIDPAEATLPYKGRVQFENSISQILVQDTDQVRDLYRLRFDTHSHNLKNFATSKGWQYIEVRTDAPLTTPYAIALNYLGGTP